MITLDYRDRRPLYEQVIERFQDLMFKGVLVQDEKMPSVRSLATDLSIYSIQGKGSFVADTGRMKAGRIREWERSFDGLVEEAGQLGIGCETVVERVRRKYEKTGEPDGERGMSDDSSGKPDKTL